MAGMGRILWCVLSIVLMIFLLNFKQNPMLVL